MGTIEIYAAGHRHDEIKSNLALLQDSGITQVRLLEARPEVIILEGTSPREDLDDLIAWEVVDPRVDIYEIGEDL